MTRYLGFDWDLLGQSRFTHCDVHKKSTLQALSSKHQPHNSFFEHSTHESTSAHETKLYCTIGTSSTPLYKICKAAADSFTIDGVEQNSVDSSRM